MTLLFYSFEYLFFTIYSPIFFLSALHGGNLMTPWRVFSARVNVSRIDFSPFACILNSLLSPLSLRCFLAFLPQQ